MKPTHRASEPEQTQETEHDSVELLHPRHEAWAKISVRNSGIALFVVIALFVLFVLAIQLMGY